MSVVAVLIIFLALSCALLKTCFFSASVIFATSSSVAHSSTANSIEYFWKMTDKTPMTLTWASLRPRQERAPSEKGRYAPRAGRKSCADVSSPVNPPKSSSSSEDSKPLSPCCLLVAEALISHLSGLKSYRSFGRPEILEGCEGQYLGFMNTNSVEGHV